MSKHKIFMVNGDFNYASWMPFDCSFTNDKSEASIAIWEGGADVSPWVYGQKSGSFTNFNDSSSKLELEAWNYFKDKDVLKIGVCKGSQNLGCYNGAILAQHSIHPYYHKIKTIDEHKFDCVSTHHQQIILDENLTGLKEEIDYSLIGWGEKLSPFHLDENDKDYNFGPNYKEPEITWFKKTRSLCVQSHPEMMGNNTPFVKYLQGFLITQI